jgi:hypothetical protein
MTLLHHSANIWLLMTDFILSTLNFGYAQLVLYLLSPGPSSTCTGISPLTWQVTLCMLAELLPLHRQAYHHTSFQPLATGPWTLSKSISANTQFCWPHSYLAVLAVPPALNVSCSAPSSLASLESSLYLIILIFQILQPLLLFSTYPSQ